MIRGEKSVFESGVHQMGGVGPRDVGRGCKAHIAPAAGRQRRERPVEFRARRETVMPRRELLLENLGLRCRSREPRLALFEEGRTQRDMLRPADRAVAGGQVDRGFSDCHAPASGRQLQPALEAHPGKGQLGFGGKQAVRGFDSPVARGRLAMHAETRGGLGPRRVRRTGRSKGCGRRCPPAVARPRRPRIADAPGDRRTTDRSSPTADPRAGSPRFP